MRDNNFVPLREVERSDEVEALYERLGELAGNFELQKEAIAELELALEDEGWMRLGLDGEREFSRGGLDKIIALSRIMTLKNPLIQRAVEIRSFYVWGQGVEIQAKDEKVQEVVEAFLANTGNRREFTSHAARVMKEKKLQAEGNIFFVLATNKLTGKVKLRSIPAQEIRDVILNPDDKNEVWFYVREWTEQRFNINTGTYDTKPRKEYYPDWAYFPATSKRMDSIKGNKVKWDQPIYHVKVGGFDDMRFGVPETYAALDWARAYKSFLEDWASLVKAISRFAWKVTKKKKGQISATKAKLASTTSVDKPGDRNPPPSAASYWIQDEDTDLAPINKSGATTSASDGKMIRLMVASAVHLPDTILSNDPQQGALATAKTLDRPTELSINDRQEMWKGVIHDLLTYVVAAAARAPNPTLSAKVVSDEDGDVTVKLPDGKPVTFDVTFPPIVAADLKERIDAIVESITLDGKTDAGTMPKETWQRLLLSALGVDHIDDVIAQMEEIEANAPAQESIFGVTEQGWATFLSELKDLKKELTPA